MSPRDLRPSELAAGSPAVPLCVALNGTLVRTDTLFESLVLVLRDWRALFRLFAWLWSGKARLKRELAERAEFDPALLPYNRDLVAYLRDQKHQGRRLVLVTGADRTIAEQVNAHLGLFDEVLASDGSQNLIGAEKARVLTERFGPGLFSYAGNDSGDLPVWRSAHSAVLVDTSGSVADAAAGATRIETEFHDPRSTLRAVVRALRPHQWAKNLLVFLPIVTAQALLDAAAWLNAGLIFLAFCATASAIYVVNDLSDLSADRRHPRKRNRPFASGALPVAAGLAMAPVLLGLGAAFAVASSAPEIVLVYGVLSMSYAVRLKEFPLIDLFTLATLYTLRLFGGGEATGYSVSLWLLGFSSFLFLSLAIVKRVAELHAVQQARGRHVARRGYSTGDLAILQMMGVGSTFVSAMVLALYVQSEAVARTYAHPDVVWAIVPLLLFWQCRLWLSTARGYMHDDPIIYATKDWVSWLIGLGLIATLIVANLPI